MFSPGARMLGAGIDREGMFSSLAQPETRLVLAGGIPTSLATAAQRNTLNLLQTRTVGRVLIGCGNLPAADIAGPPPLDSFANWLGSRSEYEPLLDVGDKLSVAYITKGFPESAYFGAPKEGFITTIESFRISNRIRWEFVRDT